MNLTLNAADVPAPMMPGTHSTLAQYEAGTAPPTSKKQDPGTMFAPASSRMNRNAGAQDLGSRFGSGGHAVCEGLTLAVGTGLQIDIAAGLAMIDGLVELAATSVDVDPDIAPGWVWLTQAGTVVVTAPPAKPVSNCVLLGSFVSDATDVLSVDRSGVVRFVSGLMERETADLDIPTDSPDSAWRGFTVTPTGRWFWDGAHYQLIETPLIPTSVPSGSTELVPTGFYKVVRGARAIEGDQVIFGVLYEE